MENISKIQIAISLFTGIIIALFVFIGTLAGNFLSEQIKGLPKKSRFKFGLFFL